jgi:hypothetical protein
MDRTQIFEFARNWIYSENKKTIWVPLSRNHARPRCTMRAQPACAATAWLGDGGTVPAHRRRRGTGGSPARGRRCGATAMGERRGGPSGGRDGGATGEAVGREAVGRAASGVRALSGQGCPDTRCAIPIAALSRGRPLTGGARSSAIFELKITLNENSSKQIARKWEKFQKNSWR